MTYEEKKQEAILRLEMWKKQGLMPVVLQKFKKKKPDLYYSDRCQIGNYAFGSLYYFNELGGAQGKWCTLLKEFEEQYDALVYHVIHDYVCGEECLFFLYVSNQPQEWEMDREEIKKQFALYICLQLGESVVLGVWKH